MVVCITPTTTVNNIKGKKTDYWNSEKRRKTTFIMSLHVLLPCIYVHVRFRVKHEGKHLINDQVFNGNIVLTKSQTKKPCDDPQNQLTMT